MSPSVDGTWLMAVLSYDKTDPKLQIMQDLFSEAVMPQSL